MRVALDARVLEGPPNSSTRTVESYARALAAAGHDVLLLQNAGVPASRTSAPGVRAPWERPLVGVACLWTPHNQPPARADAPHVATIHDANPLGQDGRGPVHRWLHARKFRFVVRACLKRSTLIVTDSECSRRDLEAHFPAVRGRLKVVPQVVHPSMRPMNAEAGRVHHDAIGVAPGGILCVCALRRSKNPLALIRAFARLPAPRRRAHPLIFAGPTGRMRHTVMRYARDAGVGQDVHLLGRRTDEELRALYSGAAVFAYPSLLEGFGLPPVEAMACGAPVVSSGRAALSEVIGDGALIVDPEAPTAFAAAIARVVQEPGLARTLRARGARAAARYTPERVAPAVNRVMAHFEHRRRRAETVSARGWAPS